MSQDSDSEVVTEKTIVANVKKPKTVAKTQVVTASSTSKEEKGASAAKSVRNIILFS